MKSFENVGYIIFSKIIHTHYETLTNNKQARRYTTRERRFL
jgi:hypothetical protein